MSLIGALLDRPRNATPVPLSSPARRGGLMSAATGGGSSTTRSQLEAPTGVGTLFAIQDMLKVSVAQTKFGLFDVGDGNDFTQEPWSQRTFHPPEKHPAAKLLARPNPFMSKFDLIERVQQTYELTGEGWMAVERFGNIPIGLWPIRPDRMEVIGDPKTYVKGYVYTSPEGEKIPLAVDDVIRITNPHPLDPHRGMGAVQTIMADLDASTMSAEWNRAFFRNSAQPGGIIEVPNEMSDEQFERLRQRWAAQHGGPTNAGRVGIIENAKWVANQMTMMDMQFIDMRKLSSDIVKQAFAFPKAQLGEADDVNRANAEAQHLVFARNLIRPRLERWREALNHQLLPMFPGNMGKGVQYEYMDPVAEDRETEAQVLKAKAEAVAALADAGYNPEDVLAVVGLAAMRYNGRPARVGGESIIMRDDGSAIIIDSKGTAEYKEIPAP